MKRRLAKSWKRIVATTLIMAMILTSTSLESLAAETDGNSPPVKTEKEETPILLENEDKQIRLVPVEGPEKNDKKGDSLKEQIDYESDEASEEEQQLQEDRISMVKQFVRRRMDYT